MKRPLGYLDGLGTGITVICLLVIAWLASVSENLEVVYRGLAGDFPMSGMTRLVLSTGWRVGVPAALVGALVAAHVWRPRYALLAIAVVTLGIAVFWYLAAYQPVYTAAGNIKP